MSSKVSSAGGPPLGGWPFQSATFPLQLADQLTHSPSTVPCTGPPVPSALEHPLAPLTRLTAPSEKVVRSLYCGLLLRAGELLELPNLSIVTAVNYWQRFYSLHSLLGTHPSVAAAAALFLASKAEENTRRVRDVINVVYRVQYMSHAEACGLQCAVGGVLTQQSPSRTPTHPSSSGGSVASSIGESSTSSAPLAVSQLFWDLKEEVLRFEQKLLRVLAYEMTIHPPHRYVLHIARELETSEEVARAAYYLANDAQRTTLSLQYAPNAVACACIYLASEIRGEQIRFHPPQLKDPAANASSAYSHHSSSSEWWEYFGRVNQLEIEDIAHQLLDLLEEDPLALAAEEDPHSSIHSLLRRIAEEEALAQRYAQQGRDDQTMEDLTNSVPSASTPRSQPMPSPQHISTPARLALERRPPPSAGQQATSAAADYSYSSSSTAASAPKRLQLHAYAPQRPFSSASGPGAGGPVAPASYGSAYVPSAPSYPSYASSLMTAAQTPGSHLALPLRPSALPPAIPIMDSSAAPPPAGR